MAHLLTALRLMLAPVVFVCMVRSEWVLCAALSISIAIVSDLADGPVARYRGTDGPRGRLFDHLSDFLFVSAGLWGMWWRGAMTPILPALAAVAFAQYLSDSLWRRSGTGLRMNPIGRWNGVLYFVPLCGDVFIRAGGFHWMGLGSLEELQRLIVWILVATTLISIFDRAIRSWNRSS